MAARGHVPWLTVRQENITPIMFAIQQRNVKSLRMLLEHGLSISDDAPSLLHYLFRLEKGEKTMAMAIAITEAARARGMDLDQRDSVQCFPLGLPFTCLPR